MDIDNLTPEQMREILKGVLAKTTGGVVEDPPRDPNTGFDMRVQIFDKKTGKLLKFQPYTMEVSKTGGSYSKIFKRDNKQFGINGEEIQPTMQEAVPEAPLAALAKASQPVVTAKAANHK